MEHQNDIFSNDLLNEDSKTHLSETAKWTKFLAIIGFIFIGFMLLGILSLIVGGGMIASALDSSMAGLGFMGFTFMMFIMLALYIYPTVALFQFSRYMKLGLNNNNSQDIATAFRHQKGLYRFMGILTIIIIAFYIIIFLFGGLMSMI